MRSKRRKTRNQDGLSKFSDNATIVRLDYRVTETGLDNKNIIQQIIRSISGPSASSLGL